MSLPCQDTNLKTHLFTEELDRCLLNLVVAASEVSKVLLDLFETAGKRACSLPPPLLPHDTWAQVRPICLFTSGIHFHMGLLDVYSCLGVKPHLSTNVQLCFRQEEAPPAIWSEGPSIPGFSASDLHWDAGVVTGWLCSMLCHYCCPPAASMDTAGPCGGSRQMPKAV